MKTKEKSLSNYKKAGRISMPVSRVAKIKAADIFIDENHLKHINTAHGKELSAIGFTAFDFVKLVGNYFTHIYKDMKTGVYYLALSAETHTKTAVIELNFVENLDFWEIKTAAPFRTAFFKNKLLVFEKGAKPL